ncbi:MAG: general secretion pathway protein D, partial [Glaciecola sp.]
MKCMSRNRLLVSNRPHVLKGLLLVIGSAFFAISSLVAAADYSPNFKNTEISEF